MNNTQDLMHNNDACGTLTLVELKMAFTTFAKQNLNGFKICLFIDGLDEYAGDQNEILDLFKTITSNSVIKAVVSSRPEPAFEEAFRKSPKLRVENLTSGDIKHYIKSKLLSHSRMESEMEGGSKLGARLIASIASKASGVFLWVFLVVRLLLDRLSKGEYPEALESIIEAYPAELQELYKHMFFERMDKAHRTEAFRLFQAIHRARMVESEIPTALRLSFMDRDQPAASIHSQRKCLTREELLERLLIFESRLKSRCCGLFEIHYYDQEDTLYIDEGRVTLLHRTVSDFLNEPSLREVIERETLQFSSEINERLMTSILHSFKCWRFFHIKHPREWKKFSADIRAFLTYCQRAESEPGSSPIEYIEEFDRQLSCFWGLRASETRSNASGLTLGNYEYHWAESFLSELHLKLTSEPDEDPLLSLAARYGLSRYVSQKMKTQPTFETKFLRTGAHSLTLRLSYWAMHDNFLRAQHLKIIESLLESGLKVNAKTFGPTTVWPRTPWQDLLSLQSQSLPSQTARLSMSVVEIDSEYQTETSEVERFDVWVQLVEMFIKFGAELDVDFKSFKGATRGRTAREVIREILATLKIEESLSSEESVAMEKLRAQIERLLSSKTKRGIESCADAALSDKPAQNRSTSSPPQPTRIIEEGLAPSQSKKDSQLKASKRSKWVRPAKPHSSIYTVTSTNWPCFRCKAVDELTEIGCTPEEIFEALKKGGVGYDVRALFAWIQDQREKRSIGRANQAISPAMKTGASPPSPITVSRPSQEPVIKRPGESQFRGSTAARSWNVVAAKGKTPGKQDESQVVGAQWVGPITPQKAKARRSKADVTANAKDQQEKNASNLNAGQVDGNGWRFTWFLESASGPQHPVSLSAGQREQLEGLLKSWAIR